MLNNNATKMQNTASTKQVRNIARALQKFNIFANKRAGNARTLTLNNVYNNSEAQAQQDMAAITAALVQANMQAACKIVLNKQSNYAVIRVHCVA